MEFKVDIYDHEQAHNAGQLTTSITVVEEIGSTNHR